jgi:hypothetical protein
MKKNYSNNLKAREPRHRAGDDSWCSLGDPVQRIVKRLEETLRRKQLSSPSIVPSGDPDDCDCSPTSPPDEREA